MLIIIVYMRSDANPPKFATRVVLVFFLFLFATSSILAAGSYFVKRRTETLLHLQHSYENSNVLGDSTSTDGQIDRISFYVPAVFNKNVTFKNGFVVEGDLGARNATLSANLTASTVTASNVIYSVTAGGGIAVTTGQTPTISNTGVLSIDGKTGALTVGNGIKTTDGALAVDLVAGGGITVDGKTISNSDRGTAQNIFKTISVSGQTDITAGSNTDTLTFVAGTGVTLSTDATNKKLTITSSTATNDSGWTVSGGNVILSTISNNVGIGTASPTEKLEVAGNIKINGGLSMLGQLTSDPVTAVNGSMYYNSSTNRYRCYENGTWKFCDTSIAGGLSGTGTANTIPKFTSINTLGDSSITDNGTTIGLGTALTFSSSAPTLSMTDAGTFALNDGTNPLLTLADNGTSGTLTVDTLAVTNIGAYTLTGDITGSGTPDITGLGSLSAGGTITFGGLSSAGIVHTNGSGVLSTSALNLAGGASEVIGTLPQVNGGTGFSTYTKGDILYSSSANTLSKLGIGSSNQVLSVNGGVPVWTTVTGSGGICSDCLISDPTSTATNTITPTGNGTIGLTVKQTSGTAGDIFRVQDSTGSTTYFKVDSNGDTLHNGTAFFANGSTYKIDNSGAATLASVNGLTLTSDADGFSIGGGTTSRTLSITGSNVTLTATGVTNVTLPTTGTLLTNTASANQTITSSQATGTVFGVTDTTNVSGAIVGQAITLSGTGAFDQTGLKFNLSGASGSNLNDLVGSGNTWKVSTSGDASFNSVAVNSISGSTITSSGNFRASNGTANAPSYSFTNSTAIGLYLPNTNELGVATSGTDRMRIDANGNVGIGTTSPLGLLNVEGSVAGKALIALNYTGTDQNILVASNSGSTKFVVDKNGTITTGIWNGTVISPTYGGTGLSSYTKGDIIFSSSANTLSKLPIGSSDQVLTVTGGVPTWTSLSASLSCPDCVLNDPTTTTTNTITAASGVVPLILRASADGTSNIFTIQSNNGGATYFNVDNSGNITTGTWHGSTIGSAYGGTGFSTYTQGDLLYSSSANTLSKLPLGSNGQVLTVAGSTVAWGSVATSGSGPGFCTDCVLTDPSSSVTNVIAPTGNGTVGLTIKQTSGTAGDILRVQNSGASTTYFKVDSNGDSVFNGVAYFANGTTYKIDNSGNATLLTVNGNTITNGTGTLTLGAGKTLTANSSLTLAGTDSKTLTVNNSLTLGGTDGKSLSVTGNTTLAANSLTFEGTESLTLAAAKNVTFADAFSTVGANSLTLTTTGSTNVTLPTTGTLLTNTESANQTITSTQTSGTLFALADSTNIGAAIKGLTIDLSGTGSFDQTGLQFNLSGASGSNLNDIIGSGSTWKISTTGAATFSSITSSSLAASGLTQGSVVFAGTGGTLSQDTSNFFFNSTTHNLGIGNSSPGEKLTVTGNASISGNLTVGNGSAIQSAFGPLTLNYKSGANTYAAGLTIQDTSGNIGIGMSPSTVKLAVAGTTLSTTGFNVNSGSGITADANNGLIIDSSNMIQKAGGNIYMSIDADNNSTSNFFSIQNNSTAAGSGTQLFRVQEDGNVGIGTSAPGSRLAVRNSSLAAIGKSLAIFDQYESQDIFTASASGVTRFVINNNGNVGIGLPSASNPLAIQRFNSSSSVGLMNINNEAGNSIFNVNTSSAVGGGGEVYLSLNGSQRLRFQAGSSAIIESLGASVPLDLQTQSAGAILFSPSTVEKMRLDANGNLGIGVTSPTSKLSLANSGQTATGKALGVFDQYESQDIFTASASGSTKFVIANNGDLKFTGSTSFLNTLTSAATAARTFTLPDATGTICLTSTCGTSVTGTVNSGLGGFFSYYPSTGTTVDDQRVLYTDGSNIGIGTSAPGGRLHVAGTFIAGDTSVPNSAFSANFTKGLFYNSSTNDGYANIEIGSKANTADNYSGSDVTFGYADGSNNWHSTFSFGSELTTTNENTRDMFIYDSIRAGYVLKIDSSGNIGIGNSPTTEAKLGITDGGIASGARFLQVGDDTFFSDIDTNNTLALIGISNGNNGLLQLGDNSAARIAGINGNIGIGTTAPGSQLAVGSSNTQSVSFSPNLTGGDRSSNYLSITQANDGSNNASFGTDLVHIEQADEGSQMIPLHIVQRGTGGSVNSNPALAIEVSSGSDTNSSGLQIYNTANNSSAAAIDITDGGFGAGIALGEETLAFGTSLTELTINRTASGVLSFKGGTDTLMSLTDAGTTGTLSVTGNIGIGLSAPGSRLYVNNSGLTALGKSLGIFDQYESQDILTASASGSTKFIIANNGDLKFTGSTSFLNTLTSAATAARTFTLPDATGTICLTSTCGTGVTGVVNSGLGGFFSYYPSDGTTVDDQSILYTNGANIGIGNTLPVEKLSVTGNATISGSLTLGNGSVLRPAYGPLTFQYKSAPNTWATGLTILDSTGNVGIGTTSPDSRFTISQTNITPATFSTTSSISNSVSGNNASYASAVDMYVSGTNGLTGAGGNDTYGFYSDQFVAADGNGQNIHGMFSQIDTRDSNDVGMAFHAKTRSTTTAGTQYGLYIDMDPSLLTTGYGVYQQTANNNYFRGNVGIGTNTPGAYLNVADSGLPAIGKALGIFNQSESQDILTASASGSTVFTVGRSNVTVADGKGFILGSSANTLESSLTSNGAMYYSTSDSKLRCRENGSWTNCIPAAGGTVNTGNGGFFSYYPSNGTTVDDQSVLYTDGTNIGIGTSAPGAKLDVATTGTTTGAFRAVGNSLTTGFVGSFTSTSTGLTTGGLLNLDWSPGSSTTATGDLFSLNIGANGNVTNLFNIKDNGSSLFSVSKTGITANIPASFNAPGDIGVAYDLVFSNQTASTIKSSAPLAIEAGEIFESNDLTLRTYNSGNVVLDSPGGVTLNQAQNWTLATSTTALNIASNLFNVDTTNNRIGIGNSAPGTTLDVGGTASVAGVLTVGASGTNQIRPAFGPLSLQYKSAANTWATGIQIQNVNGNVGIGGTTAPIGRLNVDATGRTAIGKAAAIFIQPENQDIITASAAASTRFVVDNTGNAYVGNLTSTSTTAVCFTAATKGGTSVQQLTDCSGTPADLAEMYATNGDMEPGDVAIPSGNNVVQKSTKAGQANAIGVIATDPTDIMGKDAIAKDRNPQPLSLQGRVPVKVSLEGGAIKVGDALTTSSIPGVAMKATKAGVIIGKAIEAYDGTVRVSAETTLQEKFRAIDHKDDLPAYTSDPSKWPAGVGKIAMLTNIGWFDPNLFLTSTGDVNGTTGGTDIFSNEYLYKNDLKSILSFKDPLLTQVSSLDTKVATLTAQLAATQDVTNVASLSASIANLTSITADHSTRIDSLQKQIDELKTQVLGSSSSATLASANSLLDGETATLSALTVSGKTNLNDLGITGKLTSGLLTLNGFDDSLSTPSATINTLSGALQIQSNALADVNFENGKVTIDTSGNIISLASVTAKVVNAEKLNITSIDSLDSPAPASMSASLGEAVLKTGQTSVTIKTNSVTNKSFIFVTAKSDTTTPLTVSSQAAGESFTVKVNSPQSNDVKFNWWIVN